MKQVFTIQALDELPKVAKALLDFCGNTKKVTLTGEIGAGKTTLVKAIGRLLNIQDTVNSPTFAIINTYHNTQQKAIHHIDLYRLETLEEAIDIGIEDYLYDDNWCFVEWSELVESILPLTVVHVHIELDKHNGRIFKFTRS